MPDAYALALATPGLGWLIATFCVAGLVRGFTGFGTALIVVPVAAQFLPMTDVILILAASGLFATTALLPRAWPVADKPEVATLALAASVMVPLGLWLLSLMDMITLRWVATAIIALTLAAVVTGWRWHGQLRWPGRMAIGGAAGVIGGMTGLTGPMVIIFYLANARSADAVRANTILFLASLDVVLVLNLLLRGAVTGSSLWIAVLLMLPYLFTTLIGQRLFDPGRETAYRWAAYGVVALAVITGLPVLD